MTYLLINEYFRALKVMNSYLLLIQLFSYNVRDIIISYLTILDVRIIIFRNKLEEHYKL